MNLVSLRALLRPVRWGVAAVAVLVVTTAAFHAVAVAPATQAAEAREQAWVRARADLARILMERRAAADIERFRGMLLERKGFSRLAVRVTGLAREHDLLLPDIGYSIRDLKDADLAKVSMAFTVNGEYGALRQFLSDLERAQEFLTIEELSLTKTPGKRGGLSVQVQLAAYLRGPAASGPVVPVVRKG